jgi:hypothetical protein
MDEAHPFEQHIGRQEGRSDQEARGALNESGARRAVRHGVGPRGANVSNLGQQAAPARDDANLSLREQANRDDISAHNGREGPLFRAHTTVSN